MGKKDYPLVQTEQSKNQIKIIMEEAINRIKDYIEQESEAFTPIDQYLICEELSGWLETKSADALKTEYLTRETEAAEDE